MAANNWNVYDSFKEVIGDGTIDMGLITAGTFKCALFTSTYVPAATDDLYSALTGEVANGLGYTTGGNAVTGVTWADLAGTTTWDCTIPAWTATGGSIVCRTAVIYHVATSQLIASSLLDNTPADVTVTDTNDLTLTVDAAGVFTLSGGWV